MIGFVGDVSGHYNRAVKREEIAFCNIKKDGSLQFLRGLVIKASLNLFLLSFDL
jgi:hypothetical protein